MIFCAINPFKKKVHLVTTVAQHFGQN
jgi:hypothetical protein